MNEENPGTHGQVQVPCFLNSRGDLGSANTELRLWQQRFGLSARHGEWFLLAPRYYSAALRRFRRPPREGKFWVLGALGHSQEAPIGAVTAARPAFAAPALPPI